MILTDTHAHVYSEEFLLDFEECFNRSMRNGVSRVFLPNIDINSIQILKELSKTYCNHYFPMMGLHPCSVKEDYEWQLKEIYKELISSKYYAIGEIGMDLYWDKSSYEIQKKAFLQQANWAIEFNLPVSIHSREATKDLIKIIKDFKLVKLRGVFHCFSGDHAEAQELIDLGFYLGIGGVVTYKNSKLPEILKSVGIDHLVLETDSPYLPPTPYRGKRNEPSYLLYIAEKLSELFNCSIEEIAEITTNNSKKIFSI